jgi:hypothetical protein
MMSPMISQNTVHTQYFTVIHRSHISNRQCSFLMLAPSSFCFGWVVLKEKLRGLCYSVAVQGESLLGLHDF